MIELERRMPVGNLRVLVAGDNRRIRGTAIVFNQLSVPLGGMFAFREKIAPEAVDRTLREALDVRALVDHDPSKILGRTTSGTLRLDKTSAGLQVTIDPPDTSVARDIVESIHRGDVTGMSFGFRTLEDDWDQKTDPITRTVLDMEVHDVSVVTYPAYPQTDVAVRSLQAFLKIKADSDLGRAWRILEMLEERGAIASHSTETTDAAWDGPANEARLKNDAGASIYRRAFAWVDSSGDADVKASYKFIHHMVNADGSVGAANIRACQTGIGVLNGGRGGTTIPAADRRGVWNHLARHLRDAGLEPPPLQG